MVKFKVYLLDNGILFFEGWLFMLETINVVQVRSILEAAGVKTRHVRREVTSAIFNGKIKQKSKFSAELTAGTMTLKQFLDSVLETYKRSWDDVNYDKLNDVDKKIISEIV